MEDKVPDSTKIGGGSQKGTQSNSGILGQGSAEDTQKEEVPPKNALRNLVSRISSRSRDVYGTVVHDLDGFSLQSDLSPTHAEAVAASIASILDDLSDVGNVLTEEDIISARIEMTESEIEVVPNIEQEICLVAMKSRETISEPKEQAGAALFRR